MKNCGKIVLGLAGGLMLDSAAFGISADSGNPYGLIADRNVFSLKSPPLPDTNVVAVTPPQKVTLLGIVSAFGREEVILKTLAIMKPGEAAKETTFSVGVGERQGEIDVLDIDHIAGSVKVKNHNVEQLLTLEKDGLKPAGGPVPNGLPAIPGVVPMAQPIPGVPMTGGVPAPSPYGGGTVTSFGGAANVKRELRVPTTAAGYSAASGNAAGAAVASPGAGTLPNHMVNWPPENNSMSPEEQAASHLVQAGADKNGQMPPFPPLPPSKAR